MEALEIALKEMIDFRKKKEILKAEVNKLHDDVKAKNDSVLRVLCPSLDNVMNDLTLNMNQQHEFNDRVQEDIVETKTEFDDLQFLMSTCRDKIQNLEEDLGLYHG
jgi:chromosome segregation ATPase